MIKTCIAGMKVMAAFAVHIAMHILAMVASAISFMIVKIAKAISLTGMAFFSQAITLLQTIIARNKIVNYPIQTSIINITPPKKTV